MKKITAKKFRKAFSLIELSIVIVIVSIMITGVLSVSVSSVNNAKIKTTHDRMKEIYKAMGNYLLTNKKLPCPAQLTLAKNSASYGLEFGSDGTCANDVDTFLLTSTNLVYGMVPVNSLGLTSDMGEDGFESKFAYIVDKRLTLASSFYEGFTGGDANPAAGITVTELPANVSTTADFAIISFGANKSGAWNSNSTTQNTPRSTDIEEDNNDINASAPFFDATIYSSSTDSDTFDDIVFAKKRKDMVIDFDGMSLIPCGATTLTINTKNYAVPAANYGQTVLSTTTCASLGFGSSPVYAQIGCGAFGVWNSFVTVPCV